MSVDDKGVELDRDPDDDDGYGVTCHFLPFRPIDGNPSWTWDGNLMTPTLSPSIVINDRWYKDPKRREVWHGHLKAGVFVSC